jgi:predicted outer membrane protein
MNSEERDIPKTFVLKDELAKYPKKHQKMTLRRFIEIEEAERDGVQMDLSEEERTAYEFSKSAAAGIARAAGQTIRPQMYEISRSVSEAIRHQANIETGTAAITRSTQSRVPAFLEESLRAQNEMLDSIEEAAEAKSLAKQMREQNEAEKLNLARSQNDALTGIVEELQSQSEDSAAMVRHQKRMNWWILSVTGLGVIVAIVLYILSKL